VRTDKGSEVMNMATRASHEDKFSTVAKQMGKWVDQVLGPGFHKYCPGESWSPAVNIYEDQTHYCVVVDIAGVKAEQIDLRTEKGMLVLSGFRRAPGVPEVTGRVRLHHMEIDHGQFSRTLQLPTDVDADEIKASYKSGFLWIHLPKKT